MMQHRRQSQSRDGTGGFFADGGGLHRVAAIEDGINAFEKVIRGDLRPVQVEQTFEKNQNGKQAHGQ